MSERIVSGPENMFIGGELKHAATASKVNKMLTDEAGVYSKWWPALDMELLIAALPHANKESLRRIRQSHDANIAESIYETAENLLVVGNLTPLKAKMPTLSLIGEGINRDKIQTVYYYGSEKSLGHIVLLGLEKLQIVDHPLDVFTYEQSDEISEAMK